MVAAVLAALRAQGGPYLVAHVTRIETYRAAILARRAAKAGISVAELIRRSEAELAVTHRIHEIRADRLSSWPSIARKAAAHGRTWDVL